MVGFKPEISSSYIIKDVEIKNEKLFIYYI